MTATETELLNALKECMLLIYDMMPGVANIALQDYGRLNTATFTASQLIAKYKLQEGDPS